MRLQTPVLPRFSLVRIDIVLFFPHIISGSTRIPNAKLAMFIFTGSPSSANQKTNVVRAHAPPKKIRSMVGPGWYAAQYTRFCATFALTTTFMSFNRSRSASTSASSLSFSNTNAS